METVYSYETLVSTYKSTLLQPKRPISTMILPLKLSIQFSAQSSSSVHKREVSKLVVLHVKNNYMLHKVRTG
jgi:hypothetical protein